MEDLDFTETSPSQPSAPPAAGPQPSVVQPSQSPIYDAAAARAFFESAGTAESVAAGKEFFAEHQQRGFFSAADRMYLLVEGTVALSVGGKSLDTLKAGEIFGELATITNSKRSATATAKTACRVISLDGGQFEKAIQKSPEFVLILMSVMIDRLRLRLARLAMMKALPDKPGDERRVFDDAMLDEIAGALGNPRPLRFTAGQTIINAGESGVYMYLPREGYVTILVDGKTLERIGPGGVFGETALVDHRAARTANAIAETNCALMTVNRKQFLDLVQENSAIGLSLLKVLGQRLQAAMGQSAK